MRIVIAGAVSSTLITLEQMVLHKMNVVGVLGYEPKKLKNVSGYSSLKSIAIKNGLDYKPFEKINDSKIINQIDKWSPDLLFIVGLSQLVGKEIINIPKQGVVGFHPTVLPKGRGRAPIAWTILNENQGGANFFMIDEGVDSGPILDQELFEVEEEDYAEDIELKILNAIRVSLSRLLPRLKKGDLSAIKQDESQASYYGKRTPNDGIINWNQSSEKIYSLIRASSRPHPGAFSYMGNKKVVVWKARLENELPFVGVFGRVLDIDNRGNVLVQTGAGLIWIIEYEMYDLHENKLEDRLKVGQRLGYYQDIEIFKLKQEIDKLKNILS